MEKRPDISIEMTIDEIFATYPDYSQKLAQILSDFGLHCHGCSASSWETLEAGVYGHGMGEDILKSLTEKLNAAVQEKVDRSTITLTKRASEKFKSLQEKESKKGWGLRFADQASGCSGFEYLLDFCEKPEENDTIFLSEGVEIYVNENSVSRLMGCQIDYTDGLKGAGFKVSNPNAKSSCGCGSSHAY